MAVSNVKLEQIGSLFDREDGTVNGLITYLAHTDSLGTSQGDILADIRIPQRQPGLPEGIYTDASDRTGSTPTPSNALYVQADNQTWWRFTSGGWVAAIVFHPGGMPCRSRRIDTLGDYVYRVTATFDSQRQTKQENNEDATIALIRGGQKSYVEHRPTFFDSSGYPLINSAGDYYEGLTAPVTLRQFPVVANFGNLAAADFLFGLAGTINSGAVTILGKTFPAGTCKLGEVSHADEPEQDNNGVEYWPINYDVSVDPDGWYSIMPNRGANELAYQTRETTDDDFEDAGWTAYDAESDDDLKQVIKRRIRTDEGQDIGSDIWLNRHGESIKIAGLLPTSFTATITAAANALTRASGTFTNEDIGTNVVVPGAGPFGRPLHARIDAIASSTVATLSAVAIATATAVSVTTAGATVNVFQTERSADWSDVPLPNNQP